MWNLIPEIQSQLTPLEGRVRPYLGLGAGVARASSPADGEWALSLSAAGGVRVGLTGPWSLLGELRVRAIDPWTGSVAGFGAGVARRY